MRRLLTILILLMPMLARDVQAQEAIAPYKFDFGGQIGVSGYLGDANESSIFKHPGFAGGVTMRYLSTTRWAFRGVLNVLTMSGRTSDMWNNLPGGAVYSFKSTAVELNVRAEFNFMPYGIGETYKRLRRWTPYLAVGFGGTLAMCGGQTAFAPALPMAFGVKYKLSERWNVNAEFCMTKVFGDRLDGDLKDLYEIKSSFIKNTDWYSNISVGITYEFGKRCETCHYVD